MTFEKNSKSNESNIYKPQKLNLPDNYVDIAEMVMEENYRKITTSKIRNILSLVSDIFNVENLSREKELSSESMAKLNTARIRIIYEAGRDKNVGNFIEETNLLNYMKDIENDRQKFINFFHYLEALVAYHRFYGGKES